MKKELYKAIARTLENLTNEELFNLYDEAIKKNNQLADEWEEKEEGNYNCELFDNWEKACNLVNGCEYEIERRGL